LSAPPLAQFVSGINTQWAIDMFTHRVVRESGALIACLKGLDVLVFSGGIGQHDAQLRLQVCQSLQWVGVHIDPVRNLQACGDRTLPIHESGSSVEIWVIPTDEGLVAAREAAALLHGQLQRSVTIGKV